MKKNVLAAMVIALAAPLTVHAKLGYNFVDLGTLGGTSSFALDINNLGWVTGNAQLAVGQPAPRLNGFVYTGGVLTNIGTLPGSNNFSRGYAINDSGVIVGESDNNGSRAFVYANGAMTGLTRVAGDNDRGVAHDINNAGTIVGISSNGVASRPTQWVGGVARDLGTLDGQTTSSGRAWGISESGLVVGHSARSGSSSQATLWNWPQAGGQPIRLGSLQSTSFSEAFAVNDDGVAVGAAVKGSTASGTSIRRAVVWRPHDDHYHIYELGSLGMTFSEAKDINDAGQIVGFATNISGSPQAAFLWNDGTMVDLTATYGSAFNFSFLSAEGINDRGDIVGWGLAANGQTHAYLLSAVPEPGSWALMAMGMAGLIAARAWRQRGQQSEAAAASAA